MLELHEKPLGKHIGIWKTWAAKCKICKMCTIRAGSLPGYLQMWPGREPCAGPCSWQGEAGGCTSTLAPQPWPLVSSSGCASGTGPWCTPLPDVLGGEHKLLRALRSSVGQLLTALRLLVLCAQQYQLEKEIYSQGAALSPLNPR